MSGATGKARQAVAIGGGAGNNPVGPGRWILRPYYLVMHPAMPHAQLTDEVRRLVAQRFAQMGVADPEQVEESILIRDGNYCGRRFQAEFAVAVWFVEENEIKF